MVEGREAGSTGARDPWDAPVWVLDGDERFTHLNEAAQRLFDDPLRKLEGKSFWSAVPDSVEDRYREAFAEVYEEGQTAEFELRCPVADRWFRIQAYPLEDRVSVHAHDVTEEVRRRRELALREQALRDAYEITTDREAETAERIDRLLALIRSTLGTEFATLSRVDPEEGAYRFVATDAEEPDALPTGEDVELAELPNCAEVVRAEQTLVLNDVEEQAPDLADPAWGIQSYLGAPVWVDGEVVGTFCFYSQEARSEDFDDWETTYVDLFAEWVGSELEHAGGWPDEA